MCQAKTEILGVGKFFYSSMIQMRQNEPFFNYLQVLPNIKAVEKQAKLGVTRYPECDSQLE